MNTATNTKPSVEKRAIYAFGKRKAIVFDATLVVDGEKYTATAPTKAAAIAEVLADAEYVRTAEWLEEANCALYAQGNRQWVFELPSGGSMCFGAENLADALERARDAYSDHPDCFGFFSVIGRIGWAK